MTERKSDWCRDVLISTAFASVMWGTALSAQSARLASARTLDAFDTTKAWTAHPSDGVRLALVREKAGASGAAMQMIFDFQGRAGYAIARGAIPLGTPGENWSVRFSTKGSMRPNTLEFKLVDKSGENVWWYTERDFTPSTTWRTQVIRQRQVRFAWGPIGGGPPRDIASIEIVVTAGEGGRGTLSIDNLVFTPLPPDVPVGPYFTVRAQGTVASSDAFAATDGNLLSTWRRSIAESPTLAFDFGRVSTYGGVVIAWNDLERPRYVVVDSSNDGTQWRGADSVGVTGTHSVIPLRDASSRFLRLRYVGRSSRDTIGVRDVFIKPLEFGASATATLTGLGALDSAGVLPRSLHGAQTYWSVVGVSGGRSEALLSEDGQLELYKRGPSLMPSIALDGELVTWNRARVTQSLHEHVRPIPTVHWESDRVNLSITAFAAGTAAHSSVYARYRLTNTSTTTLRAQLKVSLLPVQVNPPWQFLNTPGGAARIRRLAWNGSLVINDSLRVTPLTSPGAVALSSMIPSVSAGAQSLAARQLVDARELGVATMSWSVALAPGASQDIVLTAPLDGRGDAARPATGSRSEVRTQTQSRLNAVARTWAREQDVVSINLPVGAPEIDRALKANLAWILINRDGAGIQPGSRSYERSWIRDGALTAEALLRLGRIDEARAFAEWYAPFQYPSGKVPCCVDSRGADPVDEHDSHGELIHLVYEVWRYSGDRAFATRMWPHVRRAAGFIDSLRRSHRTAAYDSGALREFRGLVPASISHEGYSAKPMHSVWDDGFALLGLKEAAALAAALGHRAEAERLGQWRDEFRSDFADALGRAMRRHNISYVPGSIELGDFDATSTTTLLAPVGELSLVPRAALDSTFARYVRSAGRRTQPDSLWNDYTPYEWRTVGSLIRLNRKADALALLDQFMGDRRPRAWQQWAEVVWRDARIPRFIGDMPHTWVGSDFIRSALDLFAYERSDDSSLVIAAGVPAAWVSADSGIVVRGLGTPWGPLSYSLRARGREVTWQFEERTAMPSGGLRIVSPLGADIESATIDGVSAPISADGTVHVRRPARVIRLTHRASR